MPFPPEISPLQGLTCNSRSRIVRVFAASAAQFFNKTITDKCGCASPTLRQKTDRDKHLFPAGFFEADQKLNKLEIEHKSLILAQIERWRHALHMQVGRQHRGACFLGGEWRTGE